MNGKNKNIKYGDFDLDLDEFNPKNIKIRVTTFLDEDVLNALKEIAIKNNLKYQTLLNQILRNYLFAKKNPKLITIKKVRQIVREELKKQG